MAENAMNIVQNERCDNLRWKGLFINSDSDPNDAHEFWCAKTQFGRGPDGKEVDNRECAPGRTCYHAL